MTGIEENPFKCLLADAPARMGCYVLQRIFKHLAVEIISWLIQVSACNLALQALELLSAEEQCKGLDLRQWRTI